MTINISRPPKVIKIGYDGENHWRPQTFDCSTLTARHPEGILTLWVMPSGVSQAFPVAVTRDGDSITWTPLDSELVQGFGRLQIHCQDGNDLGKSDIMDFMVCESIVDGGEHPSETPSWAARVVEATGHYPKIQNGNWYVWDVQNGEWSDTGVSAGGDVSPEQIAEAIEEYFDEHPIQAPVQSVNGKTGAVTLGASDVGALPDDTVIPAEVTEQTVAGWGFTKNTGTYSKPSGGIPASDLASGVIPVVPQMATAANMSDWTSGKTVDAAVLKADFQDAGQNLVNIGSVVNAHTGDIIDLQNDKADKSEIPTNTSDLTNDSGFQTAAQVQTYVQQQIAAIPDELPTVSSTDNGKFLRVVSGAWAAQAVSSAESNSFGGGS